jgi:hypothetical protein
MLSYRGSANPAPRVAIANLPAAITNGAWFWKRFTTLWYKKNGAGYGDYDEETLQDAIRERPLLGDGAMGTQLMLPGWNRATAARHGI